MTEVSEGDRSIRGRKKYQKYQRATEVSEGGSFRQKYQRATEVSEGDRNQRVTEVSECFSRINTRGRQKYQRGK